MCIGDVSLLIYHKLYRHTTFYACFFGHVGIVNTVGKILLQVAVELRHLLYPFHWFFGWWICFYNGAACTGCMWVSDNANVGISRVAGVIFQAYLFVPEIVYRSQPVFR